MTTGKLLQLPVTSRANVFIHRLLAFDPSSPDAAVDPTTLPLQMALPLAAVGPVADDWHAGVWVNRTTGRILVAGSGRGGGAINKAAGHYRLWVRVTGGTEAPEWPVCRFDVLDTY